MTPARATSTLRRRAIRLAQVVLALLALYLVLVNALLNTALLEALINRRPERFQMHWQRGLMLWPGRISLWDVDMGGQAGRNAWQIKAQRVSGRLALWSLRDKELRFIELDGDRPEIGIERREQALAPLPPYANALRLRFDDVQVRSMLRLVVGGSVLEGEVEAQAAWSQQLRGGRFELLPSTVRLHNARLSRDDLVLLSALDLSATGRIDAHLRREHRGLAMLDFLVARLKLDGKGPGASLAMDPDFHFDYALRAGEGDVNADIGFERGELLRDSTLEMRVPLQARATSGVESEGDANFRLQVLEQGIGLFLQLPPAPGLVENASARLLLESRRLPLPPWRAELQRLSGDIDLHSRFSSLDLIQPLLERLPNFRLDGSGDVQAHLTLAKGRVAEGTHIAVDEAMFDIVAWSHRFRGAAQGTLQYQVDATGLPQMTAAVTLDRFDLAPEVAPRSILGSGRGLVLDLASHGDLSALRENIEAHVRFADASLPDLARFNRYLPPHGLKFLSGTGRIGADIDLRVAENRNAGSFKLNAAAASVQMGDLVMKADVALDARLRADSLAARSFHLPGTRLTISKAAIVQPAQEQVQGWWGVADVSHGEMDFEAPMALSADARVKLRDVAPLLAIFAQRKQLPGWVRKLVDAGEATAEGRLARQDACMVFDQVHASNARFEVLGRIRYCGEKPSGQLHARWGVLGIGVELDQGRRTLHLKGAKTWFEAQPAYLPTR